MVMKGYKITNIDRSKKYGVVADSLKKLKEKGDAKFEVNKE
jgi:CIDE-N domain